MTIYSETGRHVQRAIEKALAAARERNTHVFVSHNNVEFPVYPTDDGSSALARYHLAAK